MLKRVWEIARESLQPRVSPEDYTGFISQLTFERVEGDTVHLTLFNETGDTFYCDWYGNIYQGLLDEEMSQAAERPMVVSIRVRMEAAPPSPHAAATVTAPKAPINQIVDMPKVTDMHTVEAPEDEALSSIPLFAHYTFENFVVGDNSAFAHAAAVACADEPANLYNPLFLYGGTGLGKTHLLQAIAHRIKARDPSQRVVYVSGEDFTNQFIEAISTHKIEVFRRRYRAQCDVLLIDDVHVLAGRERTQAEFFHTFNALLAAGKQIVLTSDQSPEAIKKLEERLRSRLKWGLITDVTAPKFETRVAILNKKAQQDNIKLPKDVGYYLAQNLVNNVREMEGALTRLVAFASFQHREITLTFAQEVLRELLSERSRSRTLSPEMIAKLVAEHFDVKLEDLQGRRRYKEIVLSRSLAMFLIRRHTQASFPQIGKALHRDHSTVMAAVKKIAAAFENDISVRNEIEAIERKLPA